MISSMRALGVAVVVVAMSSAAWASPEVLTDRCSGEVAFTPTYDRNPTDHGSVILKRAARGLAVDHVQGRARRGRLRPMVVPLDDRQRLRSRHLARPRQRQRARGMPDLHGRPGVGRGRERVQEDHDARLVRVPGMDGRALALREPPRPPQGPARTRSQAHDRVPVGRRRRDLHRGTDGSSMDGRVASTAAG